MRWNLRKIKEVALIRPPKKLAKSRVGSDDLVSVVPMECLGIDKKFFGSEKEGVLENVYSKYVYFEDDDVVIAKITPCFENGKIGVASGLKNGIGFGSSEFVPFRCNDDLCPAFLYHFMDRDSFRNEGSRLMTGAVGHKRIPKDFYEEFSIPIPPLEEQERIVEVLDEAFVAIDKAKANIERNLTNARELFQSRLNDIFSNPSEDWEVVNLKAVLDMYQPKTISRKEMVEDGKFPVFGANGQIGWYNEFNHENPEVLLTCRGATCGFLNWSLPNSWINGNAMVMRPKDSSQLSQEFLFKALEGGVDTTKAITGSAQPQITRKSLNPLCIPIPPLDEQEQMVRELDSLKEKRKDLEVRYQAAFDNLEELRQSILEQAFEGKHTEPVAA